jgi:hypothetical protein
MANEPMPWQLTVVALRKLLENVPDGVVVALRVPAGGIGDPELPLVLSLRTSHTGGPVFRFEPVTEAPSP